MARLDSAVIVTIKLNCELSLWQAIKLRIAGKNMITIVEETLKEMKTKLKMEEKKDAV